MLPIGENEIGAPIAVGGIGASLHSTARGAAPRKGDRGSGVCDPQCVAHTPAPAYATLG